MALQLYRRFGKRAVDLVGAGGALLALGPVLLGCAALVRASMGAPVLFRQPRPGKGGRLFTILKFRTMRDAVDEDGDPLPDGRRLTPVGRFLRATSLDELPELLNVLRGEMSLIGPRPLLVQYLPRYDRWQARRHEVLPGLTGWAQVHGRNTLNWEDKFDYDVWYVDNVSLRLDIEIVLRTLVKLISREGISAPGHATAREFMGSRAQPLLH